ncbi:MAG: SpvB/TcaC N-terminal domain-containing protein [Caldilineaceae bacterium]
MISSEQPLQTNSPNAAGNQQESPTNNIALPTISLPKGGGAIRGMGEKFAANPVTGTGSMSVPLATSPGRSGFGPQLTLSYDSGAGNGPFGLGWKLSLPAITRKTDKGLPQYRDANESDVFILSGAEDLVPEFKQDANGDWVLQDGKHLINEEPRVVDGVTYRVRRYRPRSEGLFARIERWTNEADANDIFWRTIAKDNLTTWYGKTADSRIAASANPSHIFSWLICQSNDDKGNVVVYGYKREDDAQIFEDSRGNPLAKAHERNRTAAARSAQRYLKHIRYGNRSPYFPVLQEDAAWPQPVDAEKPDGSNAWLFEVVFDYGEHDGNVPVPRRSALWPCRPDPFSTYRAGFEVRTYRLCQRVLMFHHFPDEEGVGAACLVHSTDFTYGYEVDAQAATNPIYSKLLAVAQRGYKRSGDKYITKSLPPLEFTYSEALLQSTVRSGFGQSGKSTDGVG